MTEYEIVGENGIFNVHNKCKKSTVSLLIHFEDHLFVLSLHLFDFVMTVHCMKCAIGWCVVYVSEYENIVINECFGNG